ncbi:MAG TPA: VOC family protein [Tepidisphaeraceae bacterium]|jgi:catechol 2,3-dioxygenase-like lactoylglutathione lyase family enzyme|nr:VOC family protein [Tepidisphaeraceae bacterium]
MIINLHHTQVGIPAGGVERCRAFYCGVLGLTEVHRPFGPNGLWVQVGDRTVHFGIDSLPDRTASNAHVAYEVDDLAEMRQRLIAAGLEIEDPPVMPGHERFQVRDPFGNQVEFVRRIG